MNKGTILTIIFIVLFALGVYIYQKNENVTPVPRTPDVVTETQVPTFTWKTEDSTVMNPDGLPKMNVYVIATYPNGDIDEKLVDTESGCSELKDEEADFQCYAAGFGYKYKIVKGENAYLIQRKGFEEGSPEYEPVPQEFEMIAQFSFK